MSKITTLVYFSFQSLVSLLRIFPDFIIFFLFFLTFASESRGVHTVNSVSVELDLIVVKEKKINHPSSTGEQWMISCPDYHWTTTFTQS